MLDLKLIDNNSFVIPEQKTEVEDEMISQAYLTLFLTKKGSIDMDESIGSIFQLGNKNIIDIRFMLSRINYDILTIMQTEYNISSIDISSIEEMEDTIKASILINKTIEVSVSV